MPPLSTRLKQVTHQADLCVVGAGLSGMCAAIAAARRGARVVLVHDRPVPGGNASPEVRMWGWG
ncbi:MAG: FAD-dependent oxidoreductase [Thermoguttaceae bacterium]